MGGSMIEGIEESSEFQIFNAVETAKMEDELYIKMAMHYDELVNAMIYYTNEGDTDLMEIM